MFSCCETETGKRLCTIAMLGLSFAAAGSYAADIRLSSGFTNYKRTFELAQASRHDSVCIVSGLIETNTRKPPGKPITVGTLSPDCRPAQALVFDTNHHTLDSRVNVFPDGRIEWYSGFTRAWLSLNGIAFVVGKNTRTLRPAKGWRNSRSWQGLAYARIGELCLLSGMLQPVSGLSLPSTATILPANCRPTGRLVFRQQGLRVDVSPNGTVSVEKGKLGTEVSLTGIEFPAQTRGNQLALLNGWSHYGGKTFASASYSIDKNGTCAVTGLIRPGSKYTELAKLPPSCRPKGRMIFNVQANSLATTRVDVEANGVLRWVTGGRGGWISLAGITIPTQTVPTVTAAISAVQPIAKPPFKLDPNDVAPRQPNVMVRGSKPYLTSSNVRVDLGYEERVQKRYFDGFIYPAFTDYLARTTGTNLAQLPTFELDAPIATEMNADRQYYAFGLSLTTPTQGDMELTISPGTRLQPQTRNRRVTKLQRVAGPCASPGASNQYQFMHAVARKNTGVASWAAYDSRVDRLLANGQGVFWPTCQALSARDRSINRTLGATHIAVLLPTVLIGTGATLEIRTVQRASGSPALTTGTKTPSNNSIGNQNRKSRPKSVQVLTQSPALSLAVTHSPLYIAGIGDSVAWGQGLIISDKHLYRFQRTVRSPSRVFQFAHSGARTGFLDINAVTKPPRIPDVVWQSLHRPDISHAARQLGTANDFCDKDRDYSGEIPRKDPITQCQIARSSRMLCEVINPNSPQVRFQCTSNEPTADTLGSSSPPLQNTSRAPSSAQPIDIRARYDYVLMTTCINDIGGENIIAGGDSEEDLQALRAKTRRNCDLRRGLVDVRRFFPNAAVAVTGYHRIASDQTLRRFCYADEDLASAEELWLGSELSQYLAGGSVSGAIANSVGDFLGRVDLEVDRAIALNKRVSAFLAEEQISRTNSIRALNLDPDTGGRGALVQAAPLRFRRSEAAFAANAKVYGFACNMQEIMEDRSLTLEKVLLQSGPEDPEAIADYRQVACADYTADQNNIDDVPRTSIDNEMCIRASAFHPNAAGALAISQRISEVLERAGAMQTRDAGLIPGGIRR